MQRHVVGPSGEHPLQIDRFHGGRQVVALAVDQRPAGEGVFPQTLGLLHQFAHGQAVGKGVLAGTKHGTEHLHPVLEAVQDGIDGDHVAVLRNYRSELAFGHIEDALGAGGFAGDL